MFNGWLKLTELQKQSVDKEQNIKCQKSTGRRVLIFDTIHNITQYLHNITEYFVPSTLNKYDENIALYKEWGTIDLE